MKFGKIALVIFLIIIVIGVLAFFGFQLLQVAIGVVLVLFILEAIIWPESGASGGASESPEKTIRVNVDVSGDEGSGNKEK